jgi:hypothetical protein
MTATIRESVAVAECFAMVTGVTSVQGDVQVLVRDDGIFAYRDFDFIAIGPR